MPLQTTNCFKWLVAAVLAATGQFSFPLCAQEPIPEDFGVILSHPLDALPGTPGFQAAWSHVRKWLEHGQDRIGLIDTPAFYGQINIDTLTVPTDEETPHWPVDNTNRNRGAGPQMGNLYFESAHLQLMDFFSRFPGMGGIHQTLEDYWNFQFNENSVVINDVLLISAGYHGGYDVILDEPGVTLETPNRLWHEMRNVRLPWQLAALIDPVRTEQSVRMLSAHILDFETYHFNRHFPWAESVSLPSSGGCFISSWAWLYSRTNDAELLQWIEGIADLYFNNRGATGLPPTIGEYSQDPWPPETLGGEPIRSFIAHLVYAAPSLPESSAQKLLGHVEAYLEAFAALNPPETDGLAYEFNTDTGQLLRARTNRFWESPSRWMQIFLTLSFVYEQTGIPTAFALADRMADAILQPGATPSVRNQAQHCALAIEGFRRLYLRSGDNSYRLRAQAFVDMALSEFYRDGWFVTEPGGKISAPLYGSGSLALVVLGWEMTLLGIPNPWIDDITFEH